MQVRCVKDFGGAVVGDLAEVPDGAEVDPVHWRPVTPPPPPSSLPPGAAEAAKGMLDGLAERVAPAKEGMLWHPRPG